MISLWVVGLIVLVLAVLVFIIMSYLYTVVPADSVDVVVHGNREMEPVTPNRTIHGVTRSSYYRIPSWFPKYGMEIHRMPLNMIEIQVRDFLTFDDERARFLCDIVAFVTVNNPLEAATKFPSGLNELGEQISKVVQSTTRDMTTKMKIREIINNREKIVTQIRATLEETVKKWGLTLQTLELIDFKDSPGSSVIHDISSIKEIEINSEARQKNAEQIRAARTKEAEADEVAKSREIQRDEIVGVRQQERDQNIFVRQQQAREEELKVQRVSQVRSAEIQRDAMKELASGQKLKDTLEGEGQAAKIKATKIAEAEGALKMAEVQVKLNKEAIGIREIEKNERIGMEAAKALQRADLKFINAEKPSTFFDLLSPSGGANLGGSLAGLAASNPELVSAIGELLKSKKS